MSIIPLSVQARLHQRSYWVAKYADGKVIEEPQCDWANLPRPGLVEVRLLCPNGAVAVLGHQEDAAYRLWQVKTAVAGVDGSRRTNAHIVGFLVAEDGLTQCYAWEYDKKKLVGPFSDNFFHMRYGGPAMQNLSSRVLLGWQD